MPPQNYASYKYLRLHLGIFDLVPECLRHLNMSFDVTNVLGKYSDNSWLGTGGIRTHSDAGEWPVAYHGTTSMNVSGIVKEGFCLEKGRRFCCGRGIYCTPDPETALHYAQVYYFQDKEYRLILQTRVNPDKLVVVKKKNDVDGEYWLLPSEEDIRPYGVCVYPTDAN
ncbi:hypothetical protein Ddc_12681 [Ditylenchus destructor]|nr:hypothetical protein Ddc_12681 [Ditylenchus destructor]